MGAHQAFPAQGCRGPPWIGLGRHGGRQDRWTPAPGSVFTLLAPSSNPQGTSSRPSKPPGLSVLCAWCPQPHGPKSGKRMCGISDDLDSNNNAILFLQDVISQTCTPARTLPGLGGDKWVTGVRDRKPRLRAAAQPGILKQRTNSGSLAAPGSVYGRPPPSELEDRKTGGLALGSDIPSACLKKVLQGRMSFQRPQLSGEAYRRPRRGDHRQGSRHSPPLPLLTRTLSSRQRAHQTCLGTFPGAGSNSGPRAQSLKLPNLPDRVVSTGPKHMGHLASSTVPPLTDRK